jgi:hypothetical protein
MFFTRVALLQCSKRKIRSLIHFQFIRYKKSSEEPNIGYLKIII